MVNFHTLTRRSLAWFWRTHSAVVLGVATAIAVLTGALLVGDSVRGSLADLVVLRLGNTDQIAISTGFFREQLAEDVRTHPAFGSTFGDVVPVILTDGFVRTQVGDGRSGPVRVYGVDGRFWEFHNRAEVAAPEGREAYVSPALAAELGVASGDTILVRIRRPTDMPAETVYGEKDDLGLTVRATASGILDPDEMGEFSLAATQGDIHAVFLPLDLLQDTMNIGERATALLVSAADQNSTEATGTLERILRETLSIDDLGIRVRPLGDTVALESDEGLLPDAVVRAANETAGVLDLDTLPVLTYLANTFETDRGTIPYSLVTAVDLGILAPEIALPTDTSGPPIVLNDWAAADLGAAPGDTLTLEYYLWQEPGQLVTQTSTFQVAGTVPIDRGDPGLAPDYPGISDSPDLADWDPPFPVDLDRIRSQDEEYWNLYRTTPKAFIPLDVGQELWQSRYGTLTSIRFRVPDGTNATELGATLTGEIARRLDPFATGIAVAGVRQQGMDASRGAVNFGEYFVYFSFFLVVSALMLAALFFKLAVEQRSVEIGLLRAVGFTPAEVRRAFMREGMYLALGGAVVGVVGGLAYGWLIVEALGTWWVGAVGTTRLTLHVSGASLALGFAGGLAAALGCVAFTLRSLTRISERRLLAGQITSETDDISKPRRTFAAAMGCTATGAGLVGVTALGMVPDAAGFFGAGSLLLVACLLFFLHWSRRPEREVLDGRGRWPVTRLGLRNVTWRPARSVVSVAMLASSTFILISVDAFRTSGINDTGPDSGLGGYSLIVEALLPVVHDPATPEGRETLGLSGFPNARVEAFRLRPGDDASCLNLYAPENPRIVAPPASFTARGRFRFSASVATTTETIDNPWLLLDGRLADGAIPVIADKHSITYVLNTRLGEDILIAGVDEPVRLRLVAALDDSIFQGELLMSEENFREAFPNQTGYSSFLVEADAESIPRIAESMRDALEDHGVTLTGTAERLASFHQVENTYLSTFQALGALGLLFGTVGLGAILLRNILERRKEMALLRALGYTSPDFMAMAIAENVLLLAGGLAIGALCALVAITPALIERGGRLPGGLLFWLLGGVFALGMITSVVATRFALRAPLLTALRSD